MTCLLRWLNIFIWQYRHVMKRKKAMKYKLNVKNDVDQTEDGYMLYLPYGYRFDDEIVHCRGYDTMKEMRESIKWEVLACDCKECAEHK